MIPAAGASTRLGEPKALVDLGGQSPLARLVAAGAVFDDGPALVVTGADDASVRAALPPGAEALWHADWALGRTGGLAAARRARPGRDLCIAPVDCPLVPAEVFVALLGAWRAAGAPARGWLAPRYAPAGGAGSQARAGRHGHPVVLGRVLAEVLEGLPPDTPLRALRAAADPLLALPSPRAEVLDDLDDPSDLARLRGRLGGPGSGGPPPP